MADDRRGGLLGVVLPAGVLVALDADRFGAEELAEDGVGLQVGAGRVAEAVATAAILLAKQAGEGAPVGGLAGPMWK